MPLVFLAPLTLSPFEILRELRKFGKNQNCVQPNLLQVPPSTWNLPHLSINLENYTPPRSLSLNTCVCLLFFYTSLAILGVRQAICPIRPLFLSFCLFYFHWRREGNFKVILCIPSSLGQFRKWLIFQNGRKWPTNFNLFCPLSSFDIRLKRLFKLRL